MKKKLLCIILALAMLLSVMPAQAFAMSREDWNESYWEAVVELKANDGTDGSYKMSSNGTDIICKISITEWELYDFQREGYILRGWSLLPFGPKMYDAEDIITVISPIKIPKHVTLYAVWEKLPEIPDESRMVEVKYLAAEGSTESIMVPYGTKIETGTAEEPYIEKTLYAVNETIDIPSLDDAAFVGWNAEYTTESAILKLTAVRETVPFKYSISYTSSAAIDVPVGRMVRIDANGGTYQGKAVAVQELVSGMAIGVPFYFNHKFTGWECSVDYDVYLRATWVLADDDYVLKYAPCDAADTFETRSITEETTVYIDAAEGTYDGYKEVVLSLPVGKPKTEHNIKYLSLKTENIIKSATAPENYKFNGWIIYDYGTEIYLTADYKAKTYPVIFKSDDGNTTSVAVEYGSAVVINPNLGFYEGSPRSVNEAVTGPTTIKDPVRSGYKFKGWNCVYNGSYYSLTAKWQSNHGESPTYISCDGTRDNCYITSIAGIVDVNTAAWYHDGIHFCLETGIMTPFAEGKFQPSSYATRGEVICALYSLETGDTTADGLYERAEAWAKASTYGAIVTGDENGSINPQNNITRQEFAAMLARYAARIYNQNNLDFSDLQSCFSYNIFADGISIAPWALSAVNWAAGTGLVLGFGNNMFAPREYITRAQLAAILLRTYELY